MVADRARRVVQEPSPPPLVRPTSRTTHSGPCRAYGTRFAVLEVSPSSMAGYPVLPLPGTHPVYPHPGTHPSHTRTAPADTRSRYHVRTLVHTFWDPGRRT